MIRKDSHGSGHLLVRIILDAAGLLNITYGRRMQVDLIYVIQTVQERKDSL